MDQNFGGVIWTNHALDRLRERGISQSDALHTWSSPDQSRYAATKGAWVYYKTYGDQKIEVVAKKNEENKWIILTVWSRTVAQPHEHKTYQAKSSGKSLWRRLFELLFVKKENWE